MRGFWVHPLWVAPRVTEPFILLRLEYQMFFCTCKTSHQCVYLRLSCILLTIFVFRPSWNRDIENTSFVVLRMISIGSYICISRGFCRFTFTFPLFLNIYKMQCEVFLISFKYLFFLRGS